MLESLSLWMTTWQNIASQKFERILEQRTYDHNMVSKEHREIERLIMEGFDQCKTLSRDNTHLEEVIGTTTISGTKKSDAFQDERGAVTQRPNESEVSDQSTSSFSSSNPCFLFFSSMILSFLLLYVFLLLLLFNTKISLWDSAATVGRSLYVSYSTNQPGDRRR